MMKRKGFVGWITVIIAWALVIVLLIVVAQYSSKINVATSLDDAEKHNVFYFRSHSATAALHSNQELMENIRIYTVKEEDDESIKKQVHKLLSNNSAYSFKIKKEGDDGFETILENSSKEDGFKRYTRMYIASPSEKKAKMVVGLGGAK